MQSKISIITPSFNQDQFIEETILSVLNQSYANIEYIIIDGGSTDNSCDIIKKYDDRIDFWTSETDNGQTAAINKGFRKATGDIIGWLNSDDLLHPDGIKNIVKGFNDYPGVDFIYGQKLVKSVDGKIHNYPFVNNENLHLEYLTSFPYTQPSCFWKRDLLYSVGYLNEDFFSTMDFDYFTRISLLDKEKQFIDLPVGIFRIQPDAKTFAYNETWDKERRIVLNTVIQSIGNIDAISLLNNLQLYEDDCILYENSLRLEHSSVRQLIGIFLRDSINFRFNNNEFQEAFDLILLMEKYLPECITKRISYLKNRSKIYRFRPIHKITRPLFRIKQLLTTSQ